MKRDHRDVNGGTRTNAQLGEKRTKIEEDGEEEGEEDRDYELKDAKSTNTDYYSDIISKLILKNKINKGNAFDIKIPQVRELSEFVNLEGENCWKKIANTLDAGVKIFGFRVDKVQADTYQILGGINRSDDTEGADGEHKADGQKNDANTVQNQAESAQNRAEREKMDIQTLLSV